MTWLDEMKKARKALRDAAERACRNYAANPTSASTRASMVRLSEALENVDKFPS
jgi:DNA polymerase I-like protein with 3'-5' exonuclease and polymerase domains